MFSTISNVITIENPSEKILSYCKTLILDNPQYANNERMGFWNGNTPKRIYYYQKDGNKVILPFGCVDDVAKEIVSYDFETDFANVPAEFKRTQTIQEFDYQAEAVLNMLKAKNGIFTSPTGSGKTITALSLIGQVKQKTLWLCNSVELLRQAESAYRLMFEVADDDIGIVKEGKVEIGSKITFALVQTMSKTVLDPYTFGCVFADETQYAIKSLENTAMFSKVLEMFKARYKYSCTAMLHRADNQEKRITMLFGNVKHRVSRDVVSDKIMNCNVKRIDTDVEKSFEYLKADGTLDFCKLQNYLASYELRNKQISDKAKELMANGNSVIVLCDRVEQINSIYSLIDSDKAVMLTGAMTSKKGKEQRKQAIEDMRNKDKLCLIASVKLAGTGLDIPCLNSLLWASVQKDEGILTQAVGRISRSLTNKQQPIFYDFVDVNIGYCEGAYKKRLRQYKKLGLNL